MFHRINPQLELETRPFPDTNLPNLSLWALSDTTNII